MILARADVVVKSALIPTAKPSTALPDFERIQDLQSIVAAIEAWLTLYHDVPTAEFPGLPTSAMAQLGHCVMLLFKLGTLREPGWDTDALRRRVDCLDVLENAARKMEGLQTGLHRGGGEEVEGRVLRKGPVLLRALREVLAVELARAGCGGGVEDKGGEADPYESLVPTDGMGFAMEPWFEEMLAASF
ncbi:hypothetical protein IMZ48_11275 [Candidatus Bathyarchaeota archaeon]|nr:hypothetical protein [Candidatus Bathyarchaeota archaeon]